MEKVTQDTQDMVFNSPLELALRLLFIFNNTSKSIDLQRLVYYNYLLVHSADIPNAPKSIHADLPRRSYEILVNRNIVKQGLTLLLSKDLIEVRYLKSGIQYRCNTNTEPFLKYFESDYSKELRVRAEWLCTHFDELSDNKLTEFIETNLGKWGSEFSIIYDETGDLNA